MKEWVVLGFAALGVAYLILDILVLFDAKEPEIGTDYFARFCLCAFIAIVESRRLARAAR